MAKCIRRMGVMFFVFIISCILLVCCSLTYNLQENNNGASLAQDTKVNTEETQPQATTPDFILSGSYDNMKTTWNQAVEYAMNNRNKVVTVRLDNDWYADDTSIHSFGTGVGFDGGIISIPRNAAIQFDLNGHTVNKKHTAQHANNYGMVFDNYGTFVLNDSSYDSELAHTIYEQNKDNPTKLLQELKNIKCGKITGGWTTGSGGGIWNVGTFIMNGGMIVGNKSNGNAGGIYSSITSDYIFSGIMEINDGIIVDNSANGGHGGGIFIHGKNTVIRKAIICCNTSTNYGGGIYTSDYTISIDKAYIAQNQAAYGGGVYAYGMCDLSINSGEIIHNTATALYGGIGVSERSRISVSGSIKVANNLCKNEPSNMGISETTLLSFNKELTADAEIFIDFDKDVNIFKAFTVNYSAFCGNLDPKTVFIDSNMKAVPIVYNGEVKFDYYSKNVYDFIYLEGNERKSYKENDKLHGYNDNEINMTEGVARYVLGNISPNTSVNTFIKNIASLGIDKGNMELYDSTGKKIYENGVAQNGITDNMLDNRFELAVGTGWCVKANGEEIYLTVLGDINGDGRISASDVIYLREIANDTELYNNLNAEVKLASLIINKGKVTSADSEILINIMNYNVKIDIFY